MYRLIVILGMLVTLASCGRSTAKMVAQKGFTLSKSSLVCIGKHPMSAALETELLGLGIQVVPYEFAQSKLVSTEKMQGSADAYSKVNESYGETKIPAAIFVKIEGYDSMKFRFIDMTDERLLAVFTYKVDPFYESPLTQSPLKRFRKVIAPYIVP